MHDELQEGRREALRILAETASRDRLTAEELDAWLRALTDLRLALGTRLDVDEDTTRETSIRAIRERTSSRSSPT